MGNALLSCCPPNTYPLARYQLVAARQNDQSTERVQLEIRTVQSGWRAAQERTPAVTSLDIDRILYSSDENLLEILNDSSEDDFEVNELTVRQICSDEEDDIGGSDFEELCFKVCQHAHTRDFSARDGNCDHKAAQEGQPDVIQTVSKSFEGRPRSFETFGSIISETHLPLQWEVPHSGCPRTPKHSASLRAAAMRNPLLGNDEVSLRLRTTSFSPVHGLNPYLVKDEGVSRPRTTSLSPVLRPNSQLEKNAASLGHWTESFSPVYRFNSHLEDKNANSHPQNYSACPVPVSSNTTVDHSTRALASRSKSNVDEADGNVLSTSRKNFQIPEVHFQPNDNDDEALEDAGTLETTKIEESQSDVEGAHGSMESIYDSGEEIVRSESEDGNSIYHETLVEVQNTVIRTTKNSSNIEWPTTDKSSSQNNSNSNNSEKNSFFSIPEILAKFSAITDGKGGCPLESSVIESYPSQQLPLETTFEGGVVVFPVSPVVPVHSNTPKACPTPSSMTSPDPVNTHSKSCRTVHAKKPKLVSGSTVNYPSLSHENQFMHLMVNPLAETEYSTSYQSTAVREPVDMSMASLNAESPPTASIDLEWDREPELGGFRRSRDLLDAEHSVANTIDSSAAGGGSHLRSSCSTPNSLEWDFKESTMDLESRIPEEEPEDVWAASETEELLLEIEQLAARALRDEDEDGDCR